MSARHQWFCVGARFIKGPLTPNPNLCALTSYVHFTALTFPG